MRLIDADELIKSYLDHNRTEFEIKNCCMANENVIAIIVNAPTIEERPQGECEYEGAKILKRMSGDHVTYKIEYLLNNLAREIYLLESYRKWKKGGAENE